MLKLAVNKAKTALLFGLLLGAVSFAVLIASQKNFRANVDLLIVQNQSGSSDYYAMSRSADYLASIITESVYSEKFLSEVNASGKISSSFLPEGAEDRLREWQKIIKISKNSNVGIISAAIFGNTQRQTAEISEAAVDVLVNKNSLFLGKGQDLEIRILSGPIIKKNPSVSQIAFASAGGFAIGVLLFLLFCVYREEFLKDRIQPKAQGSFEINLKNGNDSKNTEYFPESGAYWEEKLKEYRG